MESNTTDKDTEMIPNTVEQQLLNYVCPRSVKVTRNEPNEITPTCLKFSTYEQQLWDWLCESTKMLRDADPDDITPMFLEIMTTLSSFDFDFKECIDLIFEGLHHNEETLEDSHALIEFALNNVPSIIDEKDEDEIFWQGYYQYSPVDVNEDCVQVKHKKVKNKTHMSTRVMRHKIYQAKKKQRKQDRSYQPVVETTNEEKLDEEQPVVTQPFYGCKIIKVTPIEEIYIDYNDEWEAECEAWSCYM